MPPVTEEDTLLLTTVLTFLTCLVTLSSGGARQEGSQLTWLVEATIGSGAVCLHLLQSSLDTAEHSPSQR